MMGQKKWDLHKLHLKHLGVVHNIAKGKGGTAERKNSETLLFLAGQTLEIVSQIIGPNFIQILDWDEVLSAARHMFAPEADTDMSRVSFREGRQDLKKDMTSYFTAKMATGMMPMEAWMR